MLGLSSAIRVEVYEFDETEARIYRADPADAGNLQSWLTPRSQTESALGSAGDAVARVRSFLPGTPGKSGVIAARVIPGTDDLAFGFRGLEFACWSAGQIFFGLGDSRQRLTKDTEGSLARLLSQLDLHRNSLAEDTKHPLYRAAPERWLETLLLEDPSRLDAQLDPRFLYSQVPALAASDRGVLDLLSHAPGPSRGD